MTYFADLTPYRYLPDETPMLNVGWLGRGHDYRRGVVDKTALTSLLTLADEPSNMTRGFHYCEFCERESLMEMEAPVPGGRVWLGNGEIHVRAQGGPVYSAPTLIIHYIVDHGYRPPDEFLDALHWMAKVGLSNP